MTTQAMADIFIDGRVKLGNLKLGLIINYQLLIINVQTSTQNFNRKERKLYGGRLVSPYIYIHLKCHKIPPPRHSLEARHKLMLTKEIFSVDSPSLGH